MKKKHCIAWVVAGATAIFLFTHSAAVAADKVVVIPLDDGSRKSGEVSTVTSANQIWMDRNLGAQRAGIKSDDPDAYGSLYQWGRLGDGHEYRESPITLAQSPTNVPGHGDFIATNVFPYDWKVGQNDSFWQGESGINNPCPAGFRLPTATELNTEKASWGSNNTAGAFASPLKLVMAGFRRSINGGLNNVGFDGLYWSSTINGTNARYLGFNINIANMTTFIRANGLSVRCIKD